LLYILDKYNGATIFKGLTSSILDDSCSDIGAFMTTSVSSLSKSVVEQVFVPSVEQYLIIGSLFGTSSIT